MPIYEYRCRNCEAMFEVLVRAGTTVTCPCFRHRSSHIHA